MSPRPRPTAPGRVRTPRPRAGARLLPALLAVGLAAACGRSSAPSLPSLPSLPPDLTGARVMLIPAPAAAPAQLDAELAFWLTQRSPATDWVLPEALQRAVDRAPAWRVRLNALPRGIASMGGQAYVVDPTYRELRRLAAVVDANLAVLPLGLSPVAEEGTPVLELTVAVVDIRGGVVLWVGSVRSPTGAAATRREVAELAEALARALFPM